MQTGRAFQNTICNSVLMRSLVKCNMASNPRKKLWKLLHSSSPFWTKLWVVDAPQTRKWIFMASLSALAYLNMTQITFAYVGYDSYAMNIRLLILQCAAIQLRRTGVDEVHELNLNGPLNGPSGSPVLLYGIVI